MSKKAEDKSEKTHATLTNNADAMHPAKDKHKIEENANEIKSSKVPEAEQKEGKDKTNAPKEGEKKEEPKLSQEESQKKRFEIAQKFAKELAKEFKKSLKAVVVYGSTAKGIHKETSDIDTFVIIDDTKLENDIPPEVKERIWEDMRRIATKVDKNITLQAFMFLTEFWESIRSVEPLIMVVLRTGIPVFDVGVFMPAKRMLQRGKLPTTMEAVARRIYVAPQHLQMANYRLKSVGHYIEQAMAAAGQAPLMLIGKIPPGKEEVPKQLKHYFVEQKLLEEKFVDYAEKIHQFAKDMEHEEKEVKDLGKTVDEYLKMCDEFIKRMIELVKELERKKKSNVLIETYKTFLRADVGALELKGIKPPEKLKDLPDVIAKEFPELKDQHEELFEKIAKAMSAAKDGKAEMIPEREIYEIKEDTKRFIFALGKKLKELKDSGELKIPKIEAKEGKDDGKSAKPSVDEMLENIGKTLKEEDSEINGQTEAEPQKDEKK